MTTSTYDIKQKNTTLNNNNNNNNNSNNNNFKFVLRDYEYIAQRESMGDGFWKDYEKWFYYSRENENYIIPTILLCIVAFFTNPIYLGVSACVVIVAGALWLCHCNNRKLDMNPHVQKRRWEIRMNNIKYIQKHGRLY